MSLAISREVHDMTIRLGDLAANNQIVESLRTALLAGDRGFQLVPEILEEVIDDNLWVDRMDANGERYRFDSRAFSRFITDPPDAGMGVTLEHVRRFLGGSDSPIRLKFEELITPGRGNPTVNPETPREGGMFHRIPNDIRDSVGSDNVVSIPFRDRSSEPQAGTSVGYAVRRLAKNRPDMLARVEAGELSAHAAMVAAGFIPKAITIPANPEKAARRLARHFRGADLDRLINALESTKYDDSLNDEV